MLKSYYGDTFTFTVTDKDELGAAINLMGSTISLTLGSDIQENTAGVTIARSDALGKFTVTVTDETMTLYMPVGYSSVSVSVVDTAGAKRTLFNLPVLIQPVPPRKVVV